MPTPVIDAVAFWEYQVQAAKADVEAAERVFHEYARGLHLARLILKEREQELAAAQLRAVHRDDHHD